MTTKESPEKKKKKSKKKSIEKAVRKLVKQYFATVADNNHRSQLHQELISRVERELLNSVMKATDNNQSQAARVLGISRTTLRKKLDKFGLEAPVTPKNKSD